ncbi:MAG: 6-pyruvoyl-tetrahydropterin synthase-related protein [Anaerolineae bacterium]
MRLSRHVATWGAVALFGVLTLGMLYPFPFQLADHVHDFGDPLLDAWIVSWVTRTIVSNPGNLYQGNVFYPFTYSLAFSETLAGSLPIVAPILWLTGNPVLAQNAIVLLSFYLSALGAFLLARHLTGKTWAGIVAGVIFAFAPFRFIHFSHTNLLSAHWMPFTLLFLHRGVETRRWRDFLAFALFFTLQALSSFYYALFMAFVVGLFVVYYGCFKWRQLGWDALLKFVVACALAGLVIIPFVLPYFEAQRIYGFSRTLAETKDLSATFTDYLVAPPDNRLYGELTLSFTSKAMWPGEHILFPGILPPLLAGIGLVAAAWGWTRARRPAASRVEVSEAQALNSRSSLIDQGFYALLGVSAFILSFGPILQLNGYDTGVPLPYLFLYSFVPGFKGTRAPVRFDMLVMLAVAILAAYGVTRLGVWLSARWGSVGATAVTAGLVVVILIEYASFPIGTAPIQVGESVPEVYRWLAQQPPGGVVLELPINTDDEFKYMYFSTYHWQPIVNGHSGFMPDKYWEIAQNASKLPRSAAVREVRDLGVKLIVVHLAAYKPEERANLEQKLATSKGLTLVKSFGDDRVYVVNPP